MSKVRTPTLLRHSHRSGIGGAEYHFDTLLLKHDSKKENIDIPQLIPGFSGSTIHEHTHWIQHTSTTVGAFLTCLRYAQYATLIRFISTFSQKIRSFLADKYHKGLPLLHIDEKTYDIHSINEFISGKEFTEFCRIWYDHQLIYKLIHYSPDQDKVVFPRDPLCQNG